MFQTGVLGLNMGPLLPCYLGQRFQPATLVSGYQMIHKMNATASI